MAAIASTTLSASVGSFARFMTSTASSNNACAKPIGCVHGRFVASGKAAPTSAELCPVKDDLNGWLGVHQTSEEQIAPGFAKRFDRLRKQQRLADGGDLRRETLLLAWFQKVVKSGGMTTPVMISHLPDLKALICAEKSSVRF